MSTPVFRLSGTRSSGNTAEVFESVDMTVDPAFLVHGEEGFHVGVLAAGKGSDEDVCRDWLSRYVVDDLGGLSCPVHLEGFTRFPPDPEGRLAYCGVFPVIPAELAVHQWKVPVCAAFLAIFVPKETEGNAAFAHLFVDVVAIRQFPV